ncbi:MAG: restriction endonuclease subunit S [Gammaproteobacteria bacterium]|nr:restriction endonuclease subunit S [Gammaproteobacteria bacterium]MBU1776178.1 restriction endonuclease subunit S [Gammaproteobacteria bacterium]MBU1969911.1 restriction endonuclease subunit S [Gammaproteobacteria bacterium]
MTSEVRRIVKLAACASFQEGYVNPSQRDPGYFGDDYKWLRATDLNDGFVFNTSRGLSAKGFASAGKSALLFAPNTLAISKSGTIGRVGILKDYMCGNRAVINIKVNPDCDTRFIFYTLLLNRQKIESLAEGSVQKNLYVSSLGRLEFELPSLPEQVRISETIGALDDRIALLRETNATLEAIAQAMFKSWFVDFDPVHAKQQGRAPEGMSEATAALFPDSFEESELGLVPRGWKVSRVEDVAIKVGMGPFGSNIKVSTFVEQGVPVISGQHLRGTLMEDLSFNFVTEAHAERLKNSCVGAGDVVFTHAGNIGQVSLIHSDALFDKYVLSQRQFFLRCNKEIMYPEWITYFFRSPLGQHLLLANASQVGVPSIARPVTYLRSIQFVLPPINLLRHFAEIADSLHRQAIANRSRIQTLATLRDTLLPRLISGQLRLPQAEAALEAVTE